jgi:hypothetical protein
VQGFELEVLKGAGEALARCEFVLTETSLISVNRGAPRTDEVIAFMKERGFRLFDVCAFHRREDHSLWQMDVLFINERSRFLPAQELNAENWSSPRWS